MWWLWWVSGHTGMDKAVGKITTGERRGCSLALNVSAFGNCQGCGCSL